MKPHSPLKEYALGIRTESKLNRSFNTLFFICKETWNTKEEAEKYTNENPKWRNNEHPSCTILRLTQVERDTYSMV